MEYVKTFFVVWGAIVGLGTLVGLLKYRKTWDSGVAISGGVALLYSILTLMSALDILMMPIPEWWAWTVAPVGLLILLLSQALSIWSGKEMKRSFSPQLSPVSNGTLVTTGPFRICRHPIILAMLMNWVGTALALGSIAVFVGYGLAAIFLMQRVAMEEKALREFYGDQFLSYQSQVSVIVPWLDPKSDAGRELESAIELMGSTGCAGLFGGCGK